MLIQNHYRMVAKYYVAVRPSTNENHTVHKDGCPFLPDADKRIYLGDFNSVSGCRKRS